MLVVVTHPDHPKTYFRDVGNENEALQLWYQGFSKDARPTSAVATRVKTLEELLEMCPDQFQIIEDSGS